MHAIPSPGYSHHPSVSSHHHQPQPPSKSPINGSGMIPLGNWDHRRMDQQSPDKDSISRQQEWEQRQTAIQQQQLYYPESTHGVYPSWSPSPQQHQHQHPSNHSRSGPERNDGYSHRPAPRSDGIEDVTASTAPSKQHRKTHSRGFLPPPLPPMAGNGGNSRPVASGSARAQSEKESPTARFDPGGHRARSLAANGNPSPTPGQHQQLQPDHPGLLYDRYPNDVRDHEFGHKRKRSEGHLPDQHGGMNGSMWVTYQPAESHHDPRAWSQPHDGGVEHRKRSDGFWEAAAGGMGPPAQRKPSGQQQKQDRVDAQHRHRHTRSVEDIKPSPPGNRPFRSPSRQVGPPMLSKTDGLANGIYPTSPLTHQEVFQTRQTAEYDLPPPQQQPPRQRAHQQQVAADDKAARRVANEVSEARHRQEQLKVAAREVNERDPPVAERHQYEAEAARGKVPVANASLPPASGYSTAPLGEHRGMETTSTRPPSAPAGERPMPVVVPIARDAPQQIHYPAQQQILPLPAVPQHRIISDQVWQWFDEITSEIAAKEGSAAPSFLGSWLYDPWKQPLLPAGVLAANVAALLEVRISGRSLGLYRERSDARAPSGWTLGWRARQAGVRVDIQDGTPLSQGSLKQQKHCPSKVSFWAQNALQERKLWGSEVYTDDSDVLAMCIHSGWIEGPAKVPPSFDLTGDADAGVPQAQENALYSPPDLKVILRVAPRLVAYRESCGGNLWSRNWLGMHDGVSLIVETVALEKSGYAAPSALPGARGVKKGVSELASLQRKVRCLALLDRAAAVKPSEEIQISVLDSRPRSVFPLSEVERGGQGAAKANESATKADQDQRFWWKVGDVVAQQLSATTAARFPTLETSKGMEAES